MHLKKGKGNTYAMGSNRKIIYHGTPTLWLYGDELPILVLAGLYYKYPKTIDENAQKVLPISESEFYEKMFYASKIFPAIFLNYQAETIDKQVSLEAGLHSLAARKIISFGHQKMTVSQKILELSNQIQETLEFQETDRISFIELCKYLLPKGQAGDIIEF